MRRIATLLLPAALGTVLVASAVSPGYATEAPLYTAVDRLDSGKLHACAVIVAGDVVCWGDNSAGQLGYGTALQPGGDTIGDDELPVTAGVVDLGGDDARQVSAGEYHTCARMVDDQVACWGSNGSGRLGLGSIDPNNLQIGDDEVPGTRRVHLGVNRAVRQLAAGGSHTCAVTDREKVMCWGDGALGALGYGNTEDIGDDEDPADADVVDLGRGRTVKDIAAGRAHTCAVTDNGNVFCWGSNAGGALGYPGSGAVGDNETPRSVGAVNLGGKKALSVAAGDGFTCVVLDTRQVRCWGDGADGRLGSGSTADIDEPTSVNAGHVALGAGVLVSQVVTGDQHACARTSDGDIRCWGQGADGRLGLGNIDDIGDDELPSTQPAVNLAGEEMDWVTAGGFNTCAITEHGRVRCWGRGDTGVLGKAVGASLGDSEAPGLLTPINLGGIIDYDDLSDPTVPVSVP